jgi:hypothetical protein
MPFKAPHKARGFLLRNRTDQLIALGRSKPLREHAAAFPFLRSKDNPPQVTALGQAMVQAPQLFIAPHQSLSTSRCCD